MDETIYILRHAELSDGDLIERLIAASARGLASSAYSPEQIEAALKHAWGLDTQLIRDQTYFVVEAAGQIVGCGGWSFRKTLFGNDAEPDRDATCADPQKEAAKVRAYFVHPAHARRGVGSQILHRCEAEAIEYGFTKLELMAMLSGVRFYERHGYQADTPIQYELGDNLCIHIVPMAKHLE